MVIIITLCLLIQNITYIINIQLDQIILTLEVNYNLEHGVMVENSIFLNKLAQIVNICN